MRKKVFFTGNFRGLGNNSFMELGNKDKTRSATPFFVL